MIEYGKYTVAIRDEIYCLHVTVSDISIETHDGVFMLKDKMGREKYKSSWNIKGHMIEVQILMSIDRMLLFVKANGKPLLQLPVVGEGFKKIPICLLISSGILLLIGGWSYVDAYPIYKFLCASRGSGAYHQFPQFSIDSYMTFGLMGRLYICLALATVLTAVAILLKMKIRRACKKYIFSDG